MTNQNDLGIMGKYIQSRPKALNIHTLINSLYPSQYAFTPFQSATIIQQKEFPDISFYQGLVDWVKLRSKTDAVIIRVGQNLWEDEQFERNYAQAKLQDMLRGLYWFFDDRISPKAQADKFFSIVGNTDLPEMEIWADWERTYGGKYSSIASVVEFMKYLEQYYPRCIVGTYTGYYWMRERSNPILHATQYSFMGAHPLWESWYTNNPANVKTPLPWSALLLWQKGTPVLDYGQQTKEIDMNVINLTIEQFYKRYKKDVQPIPSGIHIRITRGIDTLFDTDL